MRKGIKALILKGYLFGIGYALACLLLSFVIYKLGLPKKYTRKIVHILVGFEWVILYHFFGASWHFLAVCVFFLILLAITYKGNLMPMISSDADNAPGTVYYAVAMTGVAIISLFEPDVMVPFGIGIMCTSLGDGLAGVVGQSIKRANPKIWGNKSLYGSIANFVFSFASAFAIANVYDVELSWLHCLALALLSAELELVTPFGLDNIAITWGVTGLGCLFLFAIDPLHYLVPVLLTVPVIAFAYKKNALTKGGLCGAIALDAMISVSLGNFGFVLLCSFFFGALVVDKIKRRFKKKNGATEGLKGDKRDLMQVFANGTCAGICAVATLFSSSELFVLGFVVALAEAFSDTASSGFGALASGAFDPFRMKKTVNGLSGGMSLIGTFAGFVGAFAISMIAYGFKAISFRFLLLATASAFLGCIIDSMLGSLVQVKYKCGKCGAITEKKLHCGVATVKHSGFEIFDNDMVNLSSGVLSVIIAVAIGTLFT